MPTNPSRAVVTRRLAPLVVLAAIASLASCSSASPSDTAGQQPVTYSDAGEFPATITNEYGEVTIDEMPERVVVVGLTEQDILLELGVVPVATTEWYGEQPYATWPWAADLLDGAEPEVLQTTNGFEFEKIAALEPDLIVGTNSGMTEDDYERLSAIAPTVTNETDADAYFTDWRAQTRQISAALGKPAEGETIIEQVDTAYADAAAAHPDFAGKTATFSQGAPYEGQLYVYPDGLNTDFLTDLGFVIIPGLEDFAEQGVQALISAENVSLLDADVMVFATEDEANIDEVLSFGTMSTLDAVQGKRAVFTDATLAGAIYFMTPLSQKYVIEHLTPALDNAVAGESPAEIVG